ncbi:retinoic acid receptor responder protein 1 [Antechinus flavipes]|uniref:retinoic acid receptor responder protein 1 n=1 Tax=Antechinus flavipes TaxID=38775 RepID=UPI002235AFA8|nr:retinoic acid receptor responder protein 1 [Antechinus flavipes]
MLARQRPARPGPTALLLVVLLAAVARASWIILMPLRPSSPELRQAARTALHFFNYRTASPSTLRNLKDVLNGSAVIMKGEKEIKVAFSVESHRTKNLQLGTCSAQVGFKEHKPVPTVNINCTLLPDQKEREQEDYKLYEQIKQLETPPFETMIPDKFGNMDPSLQPLWELAMIGNSFVMWEKTTVTSYYYVQQITNIKKRITPDDFIALHYKVLLHEFKSQEIISCQVHLVWHPEKPSKTQYHCQDSGTQENGSGHGEGSGEHSL